MSSIVYVSIATTDGTRLRRHNVPVLAHNRLIVARKHGANSPTPGAVVPGLFSRGEMSPTLPGKLASGLNAGTYIEGRKWGPCEEKDGGLTLPAEAVEVIAAHVARQEVKLPDGSVTHPWRLATADEAARLAEAVDEETANVVASLLANTARGAGLTPRSSGPAPSEVSADLAQRLTAMEEELAQLRQEKAEREAAEAAAKAEAEMLARVEATIRAKIAAEMAEAKAKADADAEAKALAEKAEKAMVEAEELRKQLAALKARKGAASE